MCEIMQKYVNEGVERGRAEMAEKMAAKMTENLRGYGLTEEQIAELVRKSSEEARAAAGAVT